MDYCNQQFRVSVSLLVCLSCKFVWIFGANMAELIKVLFGMKTFGVPKECCIWRGSWSLHGKGRPLPYYFGHLLFSISAGVVVSVIVLWWLYVREGNIPDIVACGSLYEFLCKIHEEYGPVASFWLGPTLCISIGSAKLFGEQTSAFDPACKSTVHVSVMETVSECTAMSCCCLR